MKRIWLITGGLLLLLTGGFFLYPVFFSQTSFAVDESRLSAAVSEALLQSGGYFRGECQAEGHRILGYGTDENIIIAYTLTMYGEYGFEDGHFVKISGSGVIPAVFRFDDQYQLQEVTWPEDGAGYTDSLQEMFPAGYYAVIQMTADSSADELKEQERRYAAAYLEKIGRDADIGEYGDYEHTLLTDVGVPVVISNLMLTYEELYEYPFWIGNRERIKDGVRYVYEVRYDPEGKQITYVQYEYDTGEIIEQYVFDGMTGKRL